MICDRIENLNNYSGLSANVKKFAEYMASHDAADFAPGKYVVDDDVYFTVKSYEPRADENVGWESHREYMDIQYVIEGRELMGIMPVSDMTEKTPYDDSTDKITYEPTDAASVLRLRAGMFALLLPQDAHHPTVIDGTVTQNKKIVAKVRI